MNLPHWHYLVFAYVMLSLLAYTLFYNASQPEKWLRKILQNEQKASITLVLLQRTTGFILFGIIPVTMVACLKPLNYAQVGLTLNNPWETMALTVVTVLLILPFNHYNGKQPETRKHYPQIRIRQWTVGLFSLNSVFWLLYLWGYELLFRGFLFFTAIEVMALHWAILVNIGIYALAHWPKGWREMLGAVPFGLLLCIATYMTGNFWYAFIVHSFLAISGEWFSLQANPEMVIAGSKQQAEKDWR